MTARVATTIILLKILSFLLFLLYWGRVRYATYVLQYATDRDRGAVLSSSLLLGAFFSAGEDGLCPCSEPRETGVDLIFVSFEKESRVRPAEAEAVRERVTHGGESGFIGDVIE